MKISKLCIWFKSFKKFLHPFIIVKEEKLYIIWLLMVAFFGLTNIWSNILMGNQSTAIIALKEGTIYTYALSICAPLTAEIIISIAVELKSKKDIEFSTYKILCCLVSIILMFILTYLSIGKYKSFIIFQVLTGLLISIWTFYMFCLGKTGYHKELLGNDTVDTYARDEKKEMSKTIDSALTLDTIIDDENGEIEI